MITMPTRHLRIAPQNPDFDGEIFCSYSTVCTQTMMGIVTHPMFSRLPRFISVDVIALQVKLDNLRYTDVSRSKVARLERAVRRLTARAERYIDLLQD